MRTEPPYNPLDKKNLGTSVADALLNKELSPLPPEEPFSGAGVYAIYYVGSGDLYGAISLKSQLQREIPIYVGKAVPAGARKGGGGFDSPPGQALYKRLADHAESIRQAANLNLSDFRCRYLAVDDIWIPLGESLLILEFKPVWNNLVEGFGNHDPGKGRRAGQMPAWDTLHPGRPWAAQLPPNKKSAAVLESEVEEYLRSAQME